MNPELSDADQPPEIKEALRALGAVFVGRIPGYLSSMEMELGQIESNQNSAKAWTTLHLLLHTIAGSAGSFGYAELGDRSRQLEHRISAALKEAVPEHSGTSEQFRTEFTHELHQFMQWISSNFLSGEST